MDSERLERAPAWRQPASADPGEAVTVEEPGVAPRWLVELLAVPAAPRTVRVERADHDSATRAGQSDELGDDGAGLCGELADRHGTCQVHAGGRDREGVDVCESCGEYVSARPFDLCHQLTASDRRLCSRRCEPRH